MNLVLQGPERWAETWRPAATFVAMANTTTTRRSYAVVVSQLTAVAPVPLGEVAAEHVIAYKMALVDAGRAPATIRHRLAVLRSLFEWAKAKGHHAGPNPAEGIPVPRAAKVGTSRALDDAEVAALLAATTTGRDRALLGLMADSGLRAAEVVALHESDVITDAGRWIVRVRSGKGGQPRKVAITARARDLVSAYLAEGEHRISGPGRSLFQHLSGGPGLTTRHLARIVAKAAEVAGLGVLRPHDLRRTFATRALSAGAPGPVVQEAMGHAHLETTARYYVPGFGGPRAAEFLEKGGT